MRWGWFFGGMTLAFGAALGLLLGALVRTDLYSELAHRLAGQTAVAVVGSGGPAVMGGASGTATPTASGSGVATPVAASGSGSAGAAATPGAGGSGAVKPPAAVTRVGELIESGIWKLVVVAVRTSDAAGGKRFAVDFAVKNDADQAATLSIPSTLPAPPRVRPTAWLPVQMAEPPALRLQMLDRQGRTYGGVFLGANGQTSGSYTFEAAPRDAIRLSYAFEVPAAAASEPPVLEYVFGVDAGGGRGRVAVDQRVAAAVTLPPSDAPKMAAKDERLQIGSTWAITALGLEVGGVSQGERIVTARLRVENLGERTLPVAATLDDATGGTRDFYVVDGAGRLAYSSSNTMPNTPVPAGATRSVDVKMRAPEDFASEGPHRLSIVVDARRDRYGVFKLP